MTQLDEVNKANVKILEEGADNSADFLMLPDNFYTKNQGRDSAGILCLSVCHANAVIANF